MDQYFGNKKIKIKCFLSYLKDLSAWFELTKI